MPGFIAAKNAKLFNKLWGLYVKLIFAYTFV